MRKEYNDRWNAPLVNPGFTEEEWQKRKEQERIEAEKEIEYQEWLENQREASGF
jgi:hypothetical protein